MKYIENIIESFHYITKIIFWFSIGISTLIFMALLYFAIPIADDLFRESYWHYGPMNIHGKVDIQYNLLHWLDYSYKSYIGHTGRWSGSGFAAFVLPLIDPMKYYPLLMFSMILIQFIGWYSFWRIILYEYSLKKQAFNLSFITMIIFWISSPSPGDYLYWFTGATEYQNGISLMLILFFFLMCPMINHHPFILRTRIMVMILLTIFITGIHEVNSLIFCILMICGTIMSICINSNNRKIWYILTIISIIGFIFMAIAPGFRVRANSNKTPFDWMEIFNILKFEFMTFFKVNIMDKKLILLFLLIAFHPSINNICPKWINYFNKKTIFLGGVIWCSFILIWIALPVIITRHMNPGRVRDDAYFWFFMGFIIMSFISTRSFYSILKKHYIYHRFLISVVYLGLSFLLLTSNAQKVALEDLFQRAYPWNKSMHERDRMIKSISHRENLDVSVPQPPPFPNTFIIQDITDNPKYWCNIISSQFYGIHSIRMKKN